ncbi:Major Facilitator Superfamily protein [Leishmania donovani]|uniref:Major Facilitator Superfamily protein n=1 Tax=Leishmania donovani TaxID=5661 RepID=A0A504XEE9_LEIDO|nr:Major Facilitator Superfamily protein [Leishmania donovani]
MHSVENGKPGDPHVVVNGSENRRQGEARKQKRKATPLPMNQLIPMTFVLLNESMCSTMLLPFVGLLVAHLKGVSVDEAGYNSGMLIGVFMLGQVLSARMWGWMSDKYGRRFPIISGLFTSGLMMLGFGLSTTVWMCAFFRFMHGLFNGNILVAKTMMADITDKTNAAKGFAFVSLCYGIGVLIGPTLGGMLYDPANSSALRWAHISKDSIFSRKPALLPSLVIFFYTNLGMLICTFFVMESNVKAQPLPMVLRYIYPCFLREPRMFVHPSMHSTEQLEATTVSTNSENTNGSRSEDEDGDCVVMKSCRPLVSNVAMTQVVDFVTVTSPLLREDPRLDQLVLAETLSNASEPDLTVVPHCGQSPMFLTRADTEDEGISLELKRPPFSSPLLDILVIADETDDLQRTSDKCRAADAASDKYSRTVFVEAERGGRGAAAINSGADTSEGKIEKQQQHGNDIELKRFGYRQAFERPVTRTVLVLYVLLSAADMTVQEILPLWGIAHADKGGLGFKADNVPCLASNLLFYKACCRYVNKLSLFRIASLWCGVSIALLPFASYIKSNYFLFPAVLLCTSVRQFFSSWCYGLMTMLTAHSAPPTHVGSIMGISHPATVKGVRVERRLERLLPPPAQGGIRTAAGCRKCEHGVQAPWGTAGTVYHAQAQHPAPVCILTGRADEAQTPEAWREHRRALQTPTRRVAAPDHGIARLAAALGAGARHAGRVSEGPAPRLARLLLELVRRARWPPPVTRATETPSPLPWSAGRCRRPCLDRGMRPSGGPSGARGARLDFAAEGGAP